MQPITRFRGPHFFLSNFYRVPIQFDGDQYPCVESAFQAAKTLDDNERSLIRYSPLNQSRKLGRKITLRPNWIYMREAVMADLLRQKFSWDNKALRLALSETYPAELIEENTWGDIYWGVCKGKGENKLGNLLMMIRKDNIEVDRSWLVTASREALLDRFDASQGEA